LKTLTSCEKEEETECKSKRKQEIDLCCFSR
jgi:hypothetical protein